MTAKTETPAPRTDAAVSNLEGQDCDAECYEAPIGHAQTLERELAQWREVAARLEYSAPTRNRFCNQSTLNGLN